MKVKGLDGRIHNWNLAGRTPLGSEEIGSSFHVRCRLLLADMYPLEPRLEEVALPGTKGLRADFFLPNRKLVVEVHGQQHYEFIMQFHQTKLGFIQACKRDQNKREFCELNGITHVELPWHNTDSEWRAKIYAGTTVSDAEG